MKCSVLIALTSVVVVCAHAFGQPPAPAPSATQAPQQLPEVAAGHAAFQAEDWQKAVESYRAGQAKGVDNPFLNFRLGYSLHMLKRYEEALECHIKASRITQPALRIDALYNAACASALLGKKDQALEYLGRAVDAGFADARQVNSDSDLDSLRSDDRFKSLVEAIGKAVRLHQQMDFMLGTWNAKNAEGGIVQTRTLSRPLPESQAIVVTTTNSGGGKWVGLVYPNQADRTWIWTEVDAGGMIVNYTGAVAPAGMRFEGRQPSGSGSTVQVRLTISPNADGTYSEKGEVCDDGTNWHTHHNDKYTKSEPAGTSGTR